MTEEEYCRVGVFFLVSQHFLGIFEIKIFKGHVVIEFEVNTFNLIQNQISMKEMPLEN